VTSSQRVDHAELPAGAIRAIRYDAGRLGKAVRTPTGGVRIPARLARVGVLTYRNPDGTTRREYRPPEEVFHTDALRSYEDAVVTINHPSHGMVTTTTFREAAVGHVRGDARRDGDFVAGELAVQDAVAIARVDAGELVELSAGYDVLFDPTPGTAPNGERYDGVQRQIRVNHVALLPPGGGRSGREVALRLDAAAAIEVDEQVPPAPLAPVRETRTDSMKTQRIDGIEYEVGSVAWQQACERRDARVAEERAALEKRATDAEAKAIAETTRADVAEKREKELKAELEPSRLDARVAERTALVEKVRRVLGPEVKLDGKSDIELMSMALAKLAPEFKVDAYEESQRPIWIRSRFDAEIRSGEARSPLASARAEAVRAGNPPSPQPKASVKLGWDSAYRTR
jgi:hypothetical protein